MSINKSWSSSSIGDISFATIAILNKDFSEPMDGYKILAAITSASP
jgi:hypothetical protein